MPRFLAIHLPAFRLERCGHAARDVAVLVHEQRNAVRVVACTLGARDQGLRVGQTATEARALVPEVVVEVLDPEAERVDRASLVQALRPLSDRVAASGDDAVVLGAEGAPLFGGEPGLVRAAREQVERFGHACRLALTDDSRAAVALAAWAADDLIVPPGGLATAVAPLPVGALEPALVAPLRALGIERLGQLARLDPASVAGRFGAEGRALWGLAAGESRGSAWAATPETEPVAVEVSFPEPTSLLPTLWFTLQGMLAQVAERLAARDHRAARLTVHLALDHGADPLRVRVRVGRPSRSADVLGRAVRARLDGVRLPAPVVGVALVVDEASADHGWQPGLTDRAEHAEDLLVLLARLEDALGEGALFAPELRDTWRPEAAWAPRRWRPGGQLSLLGRSGATRPDPVAPHVRHESTLPRPRPTVLLERPLPVTVRTRSDARPARVLLEHGWATVSRAAGPERLSGQWWTAAPFDRDYWVLELDGRLGWLFRESDRWWLHGWFD